MKTLVKCPKSIVKLKYGLNYDIGGDEGNKPTESKESDAINNSTDHKRDEEGSMLNVGT
jgi:hypothetical protein